MSVRVRLVGAGVMGADHAKLLARAVSGAELVAVFDADEKRAGAVAATHGADSTFADPRQLIGDDGIDAVLVASPDETHSPLVLACLDAGKPVLCEKPLATSSGACLEIVEREVAIGRRLVHVGFMRRFDPGYVEMKRRLRSGELGAPLLLHCIHRNASATPYTTSEGIIANSAVHEIDIARWLFDAEVARALVVTPRSSTLAQITDPQILLLHMAGGAVVDAEIFVNARYGYDVRAELVCESGTVSLIPPAEVELRRSGIEGFLHPDDWRQRFAAAYRGELQAWIDSVREGTAVGASAFDGYAATVVAEAALESLRTGRPLDVRFVSRPTLYG